MEKITELRAHNLYFPTNIIWVIKSLKKRRAEHTACMRGIRSI